MYQPEYYKERKESRAIDFIQKNPFGILIAQKELLTVHIPMIFDLDSKCLICHVSRMNPMSELEIGHKMKAVFHGAHAYIDPALYEQKRNVPTWNYIAVHITGTLKKDESIKDEVAMERLIKHVDQAYIQTWKQLDPGYLNGMLKGVKTMIIKVDKIEMARKLSQNKSAKDRENIIDHLLNQNDTNAQRIAEEMKKTD